MRVFQSEQPLAATLAAVGSAPGKLDGSATKGRAALYAVARYDLARLLGLTRAGKGLQQNVFYETELADHARQNLNFQLPQGAQFQASIEIIPAGCCGLALRRVALEVRTGAAAVSAAVFDCQMPVARLVLAELPPASADGLWTWVVIDAYEAERPAAKAAPKK